MKLRALVTAIVALTAVLTIQAVQRPDPGRVAMEAAKKKEVVDGDLEGAIKQYQKIAEGKDRVLAAEALLRMAEAYEKLGDRRARDLFARIISEFPEQKEAVAVARTRLGVAGVTQTGRSDRAVWTQKVDMFGRVARDGRFISFTDWSGFSNLSLYDLRTNTDRPLSGNKGWPDTDPNWGEAQWSTVSPDGQYVAYFWTGPAQEIRIVSVAAGSVPRTLVKLSEGYAQAIDWSPDGKLLAFANGGTGQIIVATVADGSTRVIKSGSFPSVGLFFSPDSRYLTYDLLATTENDDVQQRDVFTLAVNDGTEVRAVSNPQDDCAMGWSPDGKYLLFSSTRTGARSLWAQPVSQGRPQGQPVLLKPEIGSPSISLGTTNTGSLYVYKNISDRDVKISKIDLNAGKLIGQAEHFSQGLLPDPWFPHWSPNGKYLAYPVRAEENGLAIRSVETGEVRRLLHLWKVQDVDWAPDGNSLLARAELHRGGIFQIDVRSGRTTFVTRDGERSFPRWSPDGTKIYYVDRRPPQDQIHIRERDIRTGAEREVFRNRWLNNFEVSPDGRYLGVRTGIDSASQTSSVWIVPVAGGEPRELARIPAAASINGWYQLSWAPDSRAVLTARRSGTTPELWLIETDTANARKLDIDVSGWTLGIGPFSGFALSPDGQSIAFMMGRSQNEVWALENFLSALK
jgi:Tol biopolymer transport system component